mmetsp:Transcript_22347/g.27460  ORF Transcript_22347/g.27460 Transcript_22347/m.27460 type:complete len:80 (+) Transcript_22347:1891-2130(+)
MVYHSMKYMQTFTEKKLQAQRPSLSLEQLDPLVYLDESYISARLERKKASLKRLTSQLRSREPQLEKKLVYDDVSSSQI